MNSLISNLAQTTTTTTEVDGGALAIVWLIYGVILILIIASMWKLYTKAGKPGWAAIIPIYNIYVLLQIVGRPTWWLIGAFIPIVNYVFGFVLAYDTARAYGKGIGFTLLLIFLPFIGYPMLAFGDAHYVGPVAAGGGTMPPQQGPPAAPQGPMPPAQPPTVQ